MSIFSYNGGCAMAMAGKECVIVLSDNRVGSNELKTVSMTTPKCYELTPRTWFACTGLMTDVESLYRSLREHKNLFQLEQEREMSVEAVGTFLSNLLYKRRFGPLFVSPIIAGIKSDNTPFIQGYDLIGAPETTQTFICAGTGAEQIMGACEAAFKPDMDSEELFQIASQCFLAGLDRDCYSGWGAVAHIITPTHVITRELEGRMD